VARAGIWDTWTFACVSVSPDQKKFGFLVGRRKGTAGELYSHPDVRLATRDLVVLSRPSSYRKTPTTACWSHIWWTRQTILNTFRTDTLLVQDLLRQNCIVLTSRIYPPFSTRKTPTFVIPEM
jgi:hypothetical protein